MVWWPHTMLVRTEELITAAVVVMIAVISGIGNMVKAQRESRRRRAGMPAAGRPEQAAGETPADSVAERRRRQLEELIRGRRTPRASPAESERRVAPGPASAPRQPAAPPRPAPPRRPTQTRPRPAAGPMPRRPESRTAGPAPTPRRLERPRPAIPRPPAQVEPEPARRSLLVPLGTGATTVASTPAGDTGQVQRRVPDIGGPAAPVADRARPRLGAAAMRRAVVLSEILNRPLALRGDGGLAGMDRGQAMAVR